MTIHKSKKKHIYSDLKVDIWKKSYDEDDVLDETFKGDQILEEKTQQKYLGYILSNDGTHTQSKKMRSLYCHKINKTL